MDLCGGRLRAWGRASVHGTLKHFLIRDDSSFTKIWTQTLWTVILRTEVPEPPSQQPWLWRFLSGLATDPCNCALRWPACTQVGKCRCNFPGCCSRFQGHIHQDGQNIRQCLEEARTSWVRLVAYWTGHRWLPNSVFIRFRNEKKNTHKGCVYIYTPQEHTSKKKR